MKFTEDSTIMEILAESKPEFRLFFSEQLFQVIPDDMRNAPMRELRTLTMPWGLPFPADSLVSSANEMEHQDTVWKIHPLWNKPVFTAASNDLFSVALMEVLSPYDNEKKELPAVIICPGGGYEDLSFYNEGLRIARKMQEYGYRTFILNYRVSPNRYPSAQLDLALAIRYLRANKEELRIGPNNIMILGFSAGGHLCASMAAYRDQISMELSALKPEWTDIPIKPDKICLCYPVISFLDEGHEDSFQKLTGGDETLREYLSVEKHVDTDYPPTFVWACEDDALVPCSNTKRMGDALKEKGILYQMKLYPSGGHGCDLGEGTSARDWIREMINFFRIN